MPHTEVTPNVTSTNRNRSHLLLLCLLQIPPLLQGLAEVHAAHRDLHGSDGIVLWETVEVVHGHHQRPASQVCVRYLQRGHSTDERPWTCTPWLTFRSQSVDLEGERLVEVWFQRLAVNFGFKLFLFVWQQVEFDVRVRAPSYIHGRQLRGLQDPNHQLESDRRGSVERAGATEKRRACWFDRLMKSIANVDILEWAAATHCVFCEVVV